MCTGVPFLEGTLVKASNQIESAQKAASVLLLRSDSGAVHLGRAAVEVSCHVVGLFKGARQKRARDYERSTPEFAHIMYNVM